MSDKPEPMPQPGTKSVPSAFDAFGKAEANEPIFTLLGRDPLAAPLVMAWAWLNRVRAGLGVASATAEELWGRMAAAAKDNPLPRAEDKRRAELMQCAEAEEIAWAMDEYRKGHAQPVESERASYSGHRPDEAAKAAQAESTLRRQHAEAMGEAGYLCNEAAQYARKLGLDDIATQLESVLPALRAANDALAPWRPIEPKGATP